MCQLPCPHHAALRFPPPPAIHHPPLPGGTRLQLLQERTRFSVYIYSPICIQMSLQLFLTRARCRDARLASPVSCLATKVQILTLYFKTFQHLTHLWSISAEVLPIARPSMSDGCATLLACAVSLGMDRPVSDVWHLNVATYGFLYIISSQRKL